MNKVLSNYCIEVILLLVTLRSSHLSFGVTYLALLCEEAQAVAEYTNFLG